MAGIEAVLRAAPIVLIVPPFHWIERPHLGVHLLQGIAREEGVDVQIVYANILFAAQIGEASYESLATMQYGMFQGERLFARAAYDLPPLGADRGAHLAADLAGLRGMYRAQGRAFDLDLGHFAQIEELVPPWVESIASVLAGGPRVVGCSTSFEQTAASIALLAAIKRHAPETVTLLGGANCEGEMAAGIRTLARDAVDHVFAGESEATFRAFVQRWRAGAAIEEPIFEGIPCEQLDALPIPDYSDYYSQLETWLPSIARAHRKPPLATDVRRRQPGDGIVRAHRRRPRHARGIMSCGVDHDFLVPRACVQPILRHLAARWPEGVAELSGGALMPFADAARMPLSALGDGLVAYRGAAARARFHRDGAFIDEDGESPINLFFAGWDEQWAHLDLVMEVGKSPAFVHHVHEAVGLGLTEACTGADATWLVRNTEVLLDGPDCREREARARYIALACWHRIRYDAAGAWTLPPGDLIDPALHFTRDGAAPMTWRPRPAP